MGHFNGLLAGNHQVAPSRRTRAVGRHKKTSLWERAMNSGLTCPQQMSQGRTLRSAVFFDRDGVLNVNFGYVHRPEDFKWIDGAREAIKLCNDSGRLVFVVTNQSGIARGLFDEPTVNRLHAWMVRDLERIGARIDGIQYCPHHPDGISLEYRRHCQCRKPKPGMIQVCLAHWPIDLKSSFLIGDQYTDLQAAAAAGVEGYLFKGGSLHSFLINIIDQHFDTKGS